MRTFLITIVTFFSGFTGFAQQTIELKNWKFKTGDNIEWAQPNADDWDWDWIKAGVHWEKQGYEGYDGYAWYRIKFKLPSSLKDKAFSDSLHILLGKIDDHDQTFLNGYLLGQNAVLCKDTACRVLTACNVPGASSAPTATIPDLSKTPMAWDVPRDYTIPLNDPRLLWDQENVIAIRVFDEIYDGGMYSLPVCVRMAGLSDYLSFGTGSKFIVPDQKGNVRQTISMQNQSPMPVIRGTLKMEVTNGDHKRVIALRAWPVELKRDAVQVPVEYKGGPAARMKATFTFTEKKSGEKMVNRQETECSGGWSKYLGNPILGGDLGTIFDVSVLRNGQGVAQMYCSWRDQRAIALSESNDWLHWSKPVVCFDYDEVTGWENDVNRPVIVEKDGVYHMWYTGQVGAAKAEGKSWIGYATSTDGKHWKRMSDKPVISPELPWEDVAVMSPHVIWDDQERIFKMWYCGGQQIEPNAIGYATSKDGLHWEKYKNNPIFSSDKNNHWEQDRTGGCMVIKREHDYLMFYIGYVNMGFAQIGMARSKDGITGWERYSENPIIQPGEGWDADATYKPYPVPDPANNRWLLYYNGRKGSHEQMGVAVHEGMDLGF